MTKETAIKLLEADIERYSRREFDEKTTSPGIQSIILHRKEKVESYKLATTSIQENEKLKAKINQLVNQIAYKNMMIEELQSEKSVDLCKEKE